MQDIVHETGLDIDEAVAGIHPVRDHPADFQFFNLFLEFYDILFDGQDGIVILFHLRQFKQFFYVRESRFDLSKGKDNSFQ